MPIPPVSLHAYDSDFDGFAHSLGAAFERYGFAVIGDHGLSQSMLDEALRQTRALFALPESVKLGYAVPGGAGQRGYTPFGREAARGAATSDLKEFWHVGRDLPPDHPHRAVMPGNLWPMELPGFRPALSALYAGLDRLGGRLLRAIARHLDLPIDAFEDPTYFAGWLYTAAAHFPKLHGNSLLFWLLLPVGLAAATRFALDAARPGSDPRQRVAILFLLGLLLASTLNSICAQKYYDAPILLFLIWHSRVEAARDPWRLTALGALILLFAAYFAVYVATAKPDATGLSQHAAKPVRFVAGKDEHRSAVLLAFARCDPGLQPQRGVDCGRFIAGFA